MINRRTFVSALALAPLGAAALPGLARAEAPRGDRATTREPLRGNAPARAAGANGASPLPVETRSELANGLALSGGYRVVRAFAAHYGALPFVVEGHGERFQVDVLRRDPSGPRGVFETEHFSLFVAGASGVATSAIHERGARALGAALGRRVASGVAVPALLSFAERSARHPDGRFHVDFVQHASR